MGTATLREARQAAGLSVDELATRSGIGKSTLYRLESGETPDPAYSTVVRLEETLGLGRGTLVFGAIDVRGSEGGASVAATHANDLDRRRGDRRSGGERRSDRRSGIDRRGSEAVAS